MANDNLQGQPNTKKRNHTIPRMLLKRFASRSTAKDHYVWQFRKDAKPFESNIKTTSAIAYFYGDPANGVEDSFGIVESRQSDMLDEILSGIDPQLYEDELRRLVWILALRTANFRSNIQHTFSSLFDGMIAQADDETIRKWLPERLDAEFDTMLDEMIDKLPPVQARAFRISLERRPSLRTKLRQWVDIYLGSIDATGNVQAFLTALRSHMDMSKLTEHAHVKSFEKIPQLDHAPDSFRPPYWRVIRTDPQCVILGDGACFAVHGAGDPGLLLRFAKDWSEIYLPIAHDAVLVASQSPQPELLSLDDINRASASLSFDQFFAARNGDHEQLLQRLIRTGAAAMTDEDMKRTVRKAWGA